MLTYRQLWHEALHNESLIDRMGYRIELLVVHLAVICALAFGIIVGGWIQ